MTTNMNAKPSKLCVMCMSAREMSFVGMNGGVVRATARWGDWPRPGTVGNVASVDGLSVMDGRFSSWEVGRRLVEWLSLSARAMLALRDT
jgi:hypothetical protein